MKNDQYGLTLSGVPPEMQELYGTQGKESVAKALLQQGLAPLQTPQNTGTMTSKISPFAGLSKIVQAYLGAKGLKDVDEERQIIANKIAEKQKEEFDRYLRIRSGQPEPEPAVPSIKPVPSGASNNAAPVIKITPKELPPTTPRDALDYASNNPYIRKNPVVAFDMQRMGKEGDQAELARRREHEIRLAAELRNAPLPTSIVVDPADPTRNLVVKRWEYSGGTLGSTGVLGIAPESSKSIKDKGEKEKGLKAMANTVAMVSSAYDALEKQGAVVKPDQDTSKSVWERAAASGVGQTIAGYAGTKAQTERDIINNGRAGLMTALKQITGMTGTQLDSKAELQFFIQTATDPTKGLPANRAALSLLNKNYNLGLKLKSDEDLEKRLLSQAPENEDGTKDIVLSAPKTKGPSGKDKKVREVDW